MQLNTAMRQTYRRAVTRTGHKNRHAAGHITGLEEVIPTGLGVNAGTGAEIRPRAGFVDKVMFAMEKEETITERLLGYGVCILALVYLLGSLARAVL